MKTGVRLRDPTAELAGTRRERVPPPDSLDGKVVALLDIGKTRGAEFIDRIEALCTQAGVATKRYRKPTNTKTAPREIVEAIALETQAAIIALSD